MQYSLFYGHLKGFIVSALRCFCLACSVDLTLLIYSGDSLVFKRFVCSGALLYTICMTFLSKIQFCEMVEILPTQYL